MRHAGQRYLLVKGKAGLGNRMLSAITGVLYSRLSNRRLVIDWSDFTYSNNGENVFPRLFVLPDCLPALPPDGRDSVYPRVWKDRLDQSAGQLVDEINPRAHSSIRGNRAFSAEPTNLDYDEATLVMWSYNQQINRLRKFFIGEFAWLAPMSDDQIMSWILREVMLPHPEIVRDVDAWCATSITERPVIGVHVRFMDRRTSIDSFYKAVDRLLGSVPDASIFLATDNAKVQDAFRARYRKVLSTQKWFPAVGISMHQNPDCPDRFSNALDAMRDMYVLSRCDYIIFPGSSTFSQMSSLIANVSREKIIDIERSDIVIQAKKLVRRWVA